jgi:hypothetical protein
MEADNQQHPYTSDSCLNEQQAAKVVMLATNTLRNDRVRNRLNIPYLKFGTRKRAAIRYRYGDLIAWLESQRVSS